MRKLIEFWKLLGKSIYTGERLEKNLKACETFGIMITVISIIMTVLNIVQKKGFVTFTTAAFCLMGLIISISTGKYKNKKVAVLATFFVSIFSFSYYAITGVNDGFAILWTLVVPVAYSYFASVKFGILMLIYFELLFVVVFYTPFRENFEGIYTDTFMNRFPILYSCEILIVVLAMGQYHISSIKQMETEQKLQEAADAAKAADNAKGSFLAQMSHEIRTPINSVLGMNEMILRKTKDEEIIGYASDIRTSGNTLLSLINSILDFSKIEDDKMELVPVEYKTIDVIGNLINSVSERARAKDLMFNINIDPKLPVKMYGDDLRITQIIVNLLTNAVKYTNRGRVELTVRNNGVEGNEVKIFVSVADTGIGIREEDKEKLFESFERLDVTKNHNIEGTGLGMSIVTKLLSLMKSSLSVSSTYGKGSDFSFTISQRIVDATPLGDYREALSEKSKVHDMKKLIYAPEAKVLVVDDNTMNLKVAQALLKLCGIKAELADSGFKAIEMIKKNHYDLIFMDHMMPRMDGIETFEKCRDAGAIDETTKVIALTANAVIGARETYLEAGFDDYLSKPIETEELNQKLAMFLPQEIIVKDEAAQYTDENDRRKEIDRRKHDRRKGDRRHCREADVEKIIESSTNHNAENYTAENRTVGNHTKDSNSPDDNYLSDNSLTVNSGDDTKSDMLGKSGRYESEKLGKTDIEDDEILEFSPESDSYEEQGAFDPDVLKPYGIDTDAGLSFCAGDKDFYLEMLHDYVNDNPVRSKEINDLYDAKDWDNYVIKVHALKSVSKTVGINKMFEQARDLEMAGKNKDIAFIENNHQKLIDEYNRISKNIGELI